MKYSDFIRDTYGNIMCMLVAETEGYEAFLEGLKENHMTSKQAVDQLLVSDLIKGFSHN